MSTGSFSADRRFVREYGEFWFDPHPELFLRTHLPADPVWQLVGRRLEKNDYESQEYIPSYVFENLCSHGFTDDAVLVAVNTDAGLARAYTPSNVQILEISAPLAETLEAGQTVTARIRLPTAADIAFINNRNFSHFTPEGDWWTGSIYPSRGELTIGVKTTTRSNRYDSVLTYRVH